MKFIDAKVGDTVTYRGKPATIDQIFYSPQIKSPFRSTRIEFGMAICFVDERGDNQRCWILGGQDQPLQSLDQEIGELQV